MRVEYNNACTINSESRPWCYIDQSGCSSGSPRSGVWGPFDYCQPGSGGGGARTTGGCSCLKSYNAAQLRVRDGSCVRVEGLEPGTAGRPFCYVDPGSCRGAKRSRAYETYAWDFCV